MWKQGGKSNLSPGHKVSVLEETGQIRVPIVGNKTEWHMPQYRWDLKTLHMAKGSSCRGDLLCDSVYRKCPHRTSKESVDSCFPSTGRGAMRGVCWWVEGFTLGGLDCCKIRSWGWWHNCWIFKHHTLVHFTKVNVWCVTYVLRWSLKILIIWLLPSVGVWAFSSICSLNLCLETSTG